MSEMSPLSNSTFFSYLTKILQMSFISWHVETDTETSQLTLIVLKIFQKPSIHENILRLWRLCCAFLSTQIGLSELLLWDSYECFRFYWISMRMESAASLYSTFPLWQKEESLLKTRKESFPAKIRNRVVFDLQSYVKACAFNPGSVP